jgi:hypothetical protein
MTRYTAGRTGRVAEEIVTYLHGTAAIYSPVTQEEEDAAGRPCTCPSEEAHIQARFNGTCRSMAGASTEEWVACTHRHTDYAIAKKCGLQLAERTARRRNAGQE